MNNVFKAVQQITLNTLNSSTNCVKPARAVPLEAKIAVEGSVEGDFDPQQIQEQK